MAMNLSDTLRRPEAVCRPRAASAAGPRCRLAPPAGMLLAASLLAGGAAGQPGGLFTPVEPAATAVAPGGFQTPDDPLALRRRLVSIDFGQLAPPSDAAAAFGAAGPASGAAPPGMLRLNLFDDASFTGLVQTVAPTFSGGYSLSGPLAGVEMGTVTLVVNGAVVAGTVRTPEATYRIRPAAGGLHAVSEVDLSRLPPLGEPISPERPGRDRPPPFGPDRGGPPPPR